MSTPLSGGSVGIRRSRPAYLLAVAAVVALGLASRRFPAYLPAFVAANAGDALWAVLVFLLLGLVLPTAPTGRLALIALAVSYADELSQLYHAPLIDAIRRTTPGALLLGWGFLWADVVRYTVGIALAATTEYLALRPRKPA